MRRFRTTALALTAIALLVLGGCGDDDGSAATDTTSQDVATDATNGDDSDAVDDTDGVDDADDTEGSGDESADAEIPDACTLVEPAEVEELRRGSPRARRCATTGSGTASATGRTTRLFHRRVIEGDRFELIEKPGALDGVGEELTTVGPSEITGARVDALGPRRREHARRARVEGRPPPRWWRPSPDDAGRLGG